MDITDLQAALPPKLKNSFSALSLQHLHGTLTNPDELEALAENFVTYTHILNNGKYKLESYINAVRYVTFKLMGLTNYDSYTRTFPDRYRNYLANGATNDMIHAYVSSFHNSKLVTQIMEQSVVSPHVLYRECFHDALFVQIALMNDTNVSDKVRSDAAAHVMNHTRPPEVKRVELDVTVGGTSVLDEFTQASRVMAEGIRERIANGSMTATEAIEQKVIDVTPKD